MGYLRLAIKHRLPIVPVAASGVDDVFIGLCDGYALGKRVRMPYRLPLWIGAGMTGLWPFSLPFPVKIEQHVGEPITPDARGRPLRPCLHPRPVRLDRVDLAVVGEGPERLGVVPTREGVRRETLMEHGKCRLEVGIAQVPIELSDATRGEQALVHDASA